MTFSRASTFLVVFALAVAACSSSASSQHARKDTNLGTDQTTITGKPDQTKPKHGVVRGTCDAPQLRLAVARDLGSVMNQAAVFFSLTNRSTTPCTIEGYPKLSLYDTTGGRMPISLRTGGVYQINDPGDHVVTIQPMGSVYFGLGWLPYRFSATKGSDGYAGCVHLGRATVANGDMVPSTRAIVRLPFCPPWSATVSAIAPANAFTIATALGAKQ